MKKIRFIWLLLVCCSASGLSASPLSDLTSTNQNVRDAAAKILRETYTPPSGTNWDTLIASLHPGTPKTNVLSFLRPNIVQTEGGGSSGTYEFCRYRLDVSWVLECYFERDIFTGCKLIKYPGQMWVNPPPSFTGISTIYFSNGQTNLLIHYKNGKQDGDMIVFTEDGQISHTMRYLDGVWQHDDTNGTTKPIQAPAKP